jgi:DNA invertase Pin-like site-specific DNA recombinase
MRTKEGMKIAKARGRLRGKKPKLTPRQEAHLVSLHATGDYTTASSASCSASAAPPVYRALNRARTGQTPAFATQREHRTPA